MIVCDYMNCTEFITINTQVVLLLTYAFMAHFKPLMGPLDVYSEAELVN